MQAELAKEVRAGHETAPEAIGCLEACRRMALIARLAEQSGCWDVAGPHLRHALEHFSALLEGARSGRIDYAARRRDPTLEGDPAALRRALGTATRRLQAIGPWEARRATEVVDLVAPSERRCNPSSVGRELAFASSHAIHHLAIVAGLLARRSVIVPTAWIEAYATQDHHDRRGMAS